MGNFREMIVYRFISSAVVAGSLSAVVAAAAPNVHLAQAPAQPQQQAPQPITKADFTKNVDSRFATIDTDKDGSLSTAEIATVHAEAIQQATARQEQQIAAEFAKRDTNKDNQLSMAEFRAAARPLKPTATPAQLVAELDSNKDGKVSIGEYRTPPMASFDRIDINKDGTLTPQEAQAGRNR